MNAETRSARLLAVACELRAYDFDGYDGQVTSGWQEDSPTEWTIELAFTNRDAGQSVLTGSLTVEFEAAGTAEVLDTRAVLEGDELGHRPVTRSYTLHL